MTTTAAPYDLIVIGAGMAGAAAAEKCATAGWRVAIADDLPLRRNLRVEGEGRGALVEVDLEDALDREVVLGEQVAPFWSARPLEAVVACLVPVPHPAAKATVARASAAERNRLR